MLQINSLSDDLSDEGLKKARPSRGSGQAGVLTITQMTSGVRDQNRVNVYINGKFALSLDVKQVVDLQIRVGKVVTSEELQELHSASEFGKLYQRALEWALTRPHSVWETRDYLRRRQLKRLQTNRKRVHDELKPLPEIQNKTIDLVMERLIARGYVDDQKFAVFYVENRFVKKGISRRRLEQELRKKHVDEAIIRDTLANSGREDDAELAKMIEKKRKKYDTQKLIRYLVNQGFEYQKVKDAVEQLGEDE